VTIKNKTLLCYLGPVEGNLAISCGVLRCFAVFCGVLRCFAVFCDVLQCFTVFCGVLRRVDDKFLLWDQIFGGAQTAATVALSLGGKDLEDNDVDDNNDGNGRRKVLGKRCHCWPSRVQ
jgi:hypothetical protein